MFVFVFSLLVDIYHSRPNYVGCNDMILIALLIEQFWTVNTYGKYIDSKLLIFCIYLLAYLAYIAVIFRVNNSCLV